MVFTVLWCAIMKPSRNHHLGVVGAAVAVLLAAIGGAPVRPFASLVRPTWLFYFNLLVPMYDITMDHLRVKPMAFYGVDGNLLVEDLRFGPSYPPRLEWTRHADGSYKPAARYTEGGHQLG